MIPITHIAQLLGRAVPTTVAIVALLEKIYSAIAQSATLRQLALNLAQQGLPSQLVTELQRVIELSPDSSRMAKDNRRALNALRRNIRASGRTYDSKLISLLEKSFLPFATDMFARADASVRALWENKGTVRQKTIITQFAVSIDALYPQLPKAMQLKLLQRFAPSFASATSATVVVPSGRAKPSKTSASAYTDDDESAGYSPAVIDFLAGQPWAKPYNPAMLEEFASIAVPGLTNYKKPIGANTSSLLSSKVDLASLDDAIEQGAERLALLKKRSTDSSLTPKERAAASKLYNEQKDELASMKSLRPAASAAIKTAEAATERSTRPIIDAAVDVFKVIRGGGMAALAATAEAKSDRDRIAANARDAALDLKDANARKAAADRALSGARTNSEYAAAKREQAAAEAYQRSAAATARAHDAELARATKAVRDKEKEEAAAQARALKEQAAEEKKLAAALNKQRQQEKSGGGGGSSGGGGGGGGGSGSKSKKEKKEKEEEYEKEKDLEEEEEEDEEARLAREEKEKEDEEPTEEEIDEQRRIREEAEAEEADYELTEEEIDAAREEREAAEALENDDEIYRIEAGEDGEDVYSLDPVTGDDDAANLYVTEDDEIEVTDEGDDVYETDLIYVDDEGEDLFVAEEDDLFVAEEDDMLDHGDPDFETEENDYLDEDYEETEMTDDESLEEAAEEEDYDDEDYDTPDHGDPEEEEEEEEEPEEDDWQDYEEEEEEEEEDYDYSGLVDDDDDWGDE